MIQRDRLPSQQFEALLKRVNNQNQEAKAEQPYGHDALVTRRIFTDEAYDFIASGDGQDWRYYRVTFTPDDQTFGGAPVYKLHVKGMFEDGTLVPNYQVIVERCRPEGSNQIWRVSVGGIYDSAKYLKFYFDSIATGNFAVEALD